eukprot:CAMPEP_0178996500 /NCGR_PEP_ID=MMETSP0795-20121207/8398_1 /TAXON_ID=88552 /ORGANISM="Amoebophrya sp., Strain Ameob2" /LENGTH=724 /DNA_ID=CAMNT_0020688887 /DNA_START=43 /DNA_END=2214 /DNA_ORIENTATION=-
MPPGHHGVRVACCWLLASTDSSLASENNHLPFVKRTRIRPRPARGASDVEYFPLPPSARPAALPHDGDAAKSTTSRRQAQNRPHEEKEKIGYDVGPRSSQPDSVHLGETRSENGRRRVTEENRNAAAALVREKPAQQRSPTTRTSSQSRDHLVLTVIKNPVNNKDKQQVPHRKLVAGSSSAEAQRVWALRNGVALPNPACNWYHQNKELCNETPGCRYNSVNQYEPVCEQTTVGWRVAELEFFSDEGCTSLLTPRKYISEGVALNADGEPGAAGEERNLPGSSGSTSSASSGASLRARKTRALSSSELDCDTHTEYDYGKSTFGPGNAFDGYINTIWVAPCCHCAMWGAAVGADFGTPEVVQCVKIWQVDRYFSPVIALAKEGASVGRDNSLWRNAVTWTGLRPAGPEVRLSGIETAMKSAIQWEVNSHKQCRRWTYGPTFTDMQLARNYCIADNNCGAVYEYACSDLNATVTITNSIDLGKLLQILTPQPQLYTTLDDQVGSMHPFALQTINLNGVTILQDSRMVQPVNASGHFEPENGFGTFPIGPVVFSIKPGYGRLEICVRDYVPDASEEGSCVHHKTGPLLEFRPYANLEAPVKYLLQSHGCVALTQPGCSASLCAEQCVQRPQCNAFQYVARQNGDHRKICQLLTMPPYPEFKPPAGLLQKDGTLDVTDFYYRLLNTTDAAIVEKQGTAWSGEAARCGPAGQSVLFAVMFAASAFAVW